MKKLKKVKWLNVIKALVFIACVGLVIHDFYMVAISQFFTGVMVGWTMFGFITFIMAWVFIGLIYEDFEEQIKSIQCYRPRHAKDTI